MLQAAKTVLAPITVSPRIVSRVLLLTRKSDAPAPTAPPPSANETQRGNSPQQPTLVSPKNDVKEVKTELEVPTILVLPSLQEKLRL